MKRIKPHDSHELSFRLSAAETGIKLRQRCQECGQKFKSTERVPCCPMTRGCRGTTIVLGEA